MKSKILKKIHEAKLKALYELDNVCTVCGKKGFIVNPFDKICCYCNKSNIIISNETTKKKKKNTTNSGVV